MTFLNNPNKRALSLLELILAVVLLSLIGLGFTSISNFSRQNVITVIRRAKLQDSIAYVLEHMSRTMANAVGDTTHWPINNLSIIGNDTALEINTSNYNLTGALVLMQVAYSYNATNYQLQYYGNSSNLTNPPPEVLATNIITNLSDLSTGNVAYNNITGYVAIKVGGRWDPANATSPTNPEVRTYTYIKIPSSTN